MSVFSKNVEFNVAELVDKLNDLTYVKKNGVFAVELKQVFGEESNGNSFITYDFIIKGTDELLSVRELNTYTDKTTGAEKESKGANILRAMVGFAAGKSKHSAKWTPVTKTMYGKDVEGVELKFLAGKEFYITNQVERTVYKDKAQESNTLRRVFSKDGLSLAEFQEALALQSQGKIKTFSEVEAKALAKEQSKKLKYKYRKCSQDEWDEANAEESSEPTAKSDTGNSLPSGIGGLPSMPTEEPKAAVNSSVTTTEVAEQKTTPAEVSNNTGLPDMQLPTTEDGSTTALPNLSGLSL
jgi:hypothetical protein